MPTMTGRSNTGLFGAMPTAGRSCSGCISRSSCMVCPPACGRPAGQLAAASRRRKFNTPPAPVAKRPFGGSRTGNRCCVTSARSISTEPATPELRAPTSRPRGASAGTLGLVRLGCGAWDGERARKDSMTIAAERRRWPAEGLTRVPYWVYSDRDVYEEEQARIFRGPTWNFLCLEAELPNPNTYRRSALGAMPVVVTRDREGTLHAFENRCAHRGSLLVLNECGEARDIVCVYHNWSYDLCGNLTGVAFRKGLRGKGGMPPECRPETYGPRKLRLETLAGLVFGTLSADAPPLERYLGSEIVARIRRVMRAPVKILAGYGQTLPSNWKLYMENVKDTYHASLLHTFFTTFRLNRLSQQGGIVVSDSGGHHVSYALAADTGSREYEQAGMRAAQEGFGLEAPQLLEA